MWKPGQLITLWGKVHRVSKCCEEASYKVCCFCTYANGCPPCINAYNYPEKNGFDSKKCKRCMPKGYFPRELKPSISGKSNTSK